MNIKEAYPDDPSEENRRALISPFLILRDEDTPAF